MNKKIRNNVEKDSFIQHILNGVGGNNSFEQEKIIRYNYNKNTHSPSNTKTYRKHLRRSSRMLSTKYMPDSLSHFNPK